MPIQPPLSQRPNPLGVDATVNRVEQNSDSRSSVRPAREISRLDEKRQVCGKKECNHILSSGESGECIDGKIVENKTGGNSQSSDMELDNDRRFL
jgi:hypothetical protein